MNRDRRPYAHKFVNIPKRNKKERISSKTSAILVTRQTGGIGDLLMITPTLRAIKEENPNIPLIFCTTENYGGNRGVLFDILKHNPHIDKTITLLELSNYDFKKVYNLGTGTETIIEQNGGHWSGNRIDIFAELANVKLKDKRPVYVVTEQEKDQAFQWIEKNIDPDRRTLIGIQMRSATSRRDWPEEKVLLLAFQIVNTWSNVSILLFYEGLIEERIKQYPYIHHLIGLPIRQVAALLDQCSLIITPDSAFLHIGGALKKKMVGLFGSLPPSARISYYPEAVGVTAGVCKPCIYAKCEYHFKCMKEIQVEDVLEKVRELLDFPKESKIKGDVLVVRMGGIGDLIMLTPSLRALKAKEEVNAITLATLANHVEVLQGLPYIDNVVPLENRHEQNYSSALDLRWRVESPEVGGTLNTELYKTVNRIDMFSKLVGVYPLEDKKVDVALDEKIAKEIKKKLKHNKRFTWIGIQATCTSNLRTMPPEYIPELINKLVEIKNSRVVLFGRSEFWHGRKSDVNLKAISGKKIINLIDQFQNVKEMIALIDLMDFVIAPDSAAVHIAAALNKKCLAVFGNMDPYLRTYYYPTVINLYPRGELECIPCWDFKNPCLHYSHLHTEKQPVGAKCMRLLTPERIFNAVKEFLNKEKEDGKRDM